MLRRKFLNADSAEKVVCLLVEMTGGDLMPRMLFDSNFELKNYDELVKLAEYQLEQIENSFLLQTNLDHFAHAQWSKTEVEPRTDDKKWFEDQYGFAPRNVKEIREFLLAQQESNLHFYIDCKCRLWQDVDRLVACMRAS